MLYLFSFSIYFKNYRLILIGYRPAWSNLVVISKIHYRSTSTENTLLKTGFNVYVFENDTAIVSVQTTKMQRNW